MDRSCRECRIHGRHGFEHVDTEFDRASRDCASAQFVVLWPLLQDPSSTTMTEHAFFAVFVWMGALNGRLICVALHQKPFIRFGQGFEARSSAGSAVVAFLVTMVGIGYGIAQSWIPGMFAGIVAGAASCLLSILLHACAHRWLRFAHSFMSRSRLKKFIVAGFLHQTIALIVSGICDIFDETPLLLTVRFSLLLLLPASSSVWAIRENARRRRWRRRHVGIAMNNDDDDDIPMPDGADSSESHTSTSSGSSDEDVYFEYM